MNKGIAAVTLSIVTRRRFLQAPLKRANGRVAWVASAAYFLGWVALEHWHAGWGILAIGGGEDALCLGGLKVDQVHVIRHHVSVEGRS